MSRDTVFTRQPARTWYQHLRSSAIPRRLIDDFLAGPGWASFDPELGYVHRDSAISWGIDGTRVIETHESHGARSHFMYAGRRPRINCYGESFAEAIQVSDGETWEEYLAAHLGEPIGNYGVGGYGPYQAYRRMVRGERGEYGGSVVILYVVDATLTRSAMRSLWALVYPAWLESAVGRPLFHGNVWPSLEVDLDTARFVERENPLRTPEELYRMCDPEWMTTSLRDDLAIRLEAFAWGMVSDLDRRATDRLAEILGTSFDWEAADPRAEAARLVRRYGEALAIEVVERARAFTTAAGKQLLVSFNSVAPPVADGPTRGAVLLRHLREHGVATFDMAEVHRREHAASGLAWESYIAPYVTHDTGFFSGHYTPRGNHLFAYSIKDSVVELLKNKPLPYRRDEAVDAGTFRMLRLAPDRVALHPGTEEVLGATARIGDVLASLSTRYAEHWDVDAIARLAGLSRSAVHRQFAATLKMTPMEYLKRIRLDEAARRLLHTDGTIARIATEVGFANAFHLSREFTRRFGVTPSAYRRDPTSRPGAVPAAT